MEYGLQLSKTALARRCELIQTSLADMDELLSLKLDVRNLVLDRLDHAYINDIVEQPTAEYISRWIFRELDAPLRRGNCRLFEVQLWETEGSSVICRREDVKDA